MRTSHGVAATRDDGATSHDDVPSVTDRVHHTSWSANLEGPEHAADVDLVVDQAVDAVEHTAPGYHVNLVTHAALGHPEEYLFEALDARFDGPAVTWRYVDQCGCGGYVTRVRVRSGD